MRRAIFLDRDGTLTQPRHWPTKPDDLVLHAGVTEPLQQLRDMGFLLVVVTNQSVVGRGMLSALGLEAMHDRLREIVGVPLDGIYACPHLPSDNCGCRKPRPGLFHWAACELDIDLGTSWMFGDTETDIQAAQRAGITKAVRTDPERGPAGNLIALTLWEQA